MGRGEMEKWIEDIRKKSIIEYKELHAQMDVEILISHIESLDSEIRARDDEILRRRNEIGELLEENRKLQLALSRAKIQSSDKRTAGKILVDGERVVGGGK
jgi:hypothetical protein